MKSENVPYPQVLKKNYRPDIDGLRAIAVLSVVLFHAFPEFITGGFIGVSIFFVISGFLITTIIVRDLESGQLDLKDFYKKRIRRIFPALIVILSVSIIFGWIGLLTEEYEELGKYIFGGAGFIANFIALKNIDYFSGAAELKPLLHLWSLGIEEQFYLIWPLALYLAWKFKNNLLLISFLVMTLSFIVNILNIDRYPSLTFYAPWTRFWEILSGAVLACFAIYKNDSEISINSKFLNLSSFDKYLNFPFCKNLLSIIGLILLIYGILYFDKKTAYPGYAALIPISGSILVIFSGRDAWVNKKILSNKIMIWLGVISYSLYLWHWTLLAFGRVINANGQEDIDFKYRFFYVLISIFLAWITYKFVEKPIRFSKKNSVVFILLAFMTILLFAGILIERNQGFSIRYPKIYQKLLIDHDEIEYKKWHQSIREKRCFLETDADQKFSGECVESGKPLIAIFGDSHAASLYPGLKNLQETEKFGIAQFTQSACPPLLKINSPARRNCLYKNEEIIEILKELKPEILILHAAWKHGNYPLTNEQLSELVKSTFEKYKEIFPNTKIIVISTVPWWSISLKRVILRAFKLSANKNELPDVMQKAELHNDVDLVLKKWADFYGFNYISPVDLLCKEDKCLTRINEELIAIDNSHFSVEGSKYFIERIKKNIN